MYPSHVTDTCGDGVYYGLDFLVLSTVLELFCVVMIKISKFTHEETKEIGKWFLG